jgi:predicted Ser/Thr protein kinase
VFDLETHLRPKIVGCEPVHEDIYHALGEFVAQGMTNKLILMYGPNGSAKSSTVDALAHAMNLYSMSEEGAVYRFNWIFPAEKGALPKARGETSTIGFSDSSRSSGKTLSYAHLSDDRVSCRIASEFKENPLYLIPMPFREELLRTWMAKKSGVAPDAVKIPPHMLMDGLSKRNQLIFDNLLAFCDGNINEVLRYVQVERFFYSKQYRIGFSTVEPRMSLDARESLLTMDRNIANLPTILQNIRIHEAHGEIIEANRGILEFSDLFKRPLEAFKYLLTTIETSSLNLPSSTAMLDIVYIASSNDKHLDAFKSVPDFSSFRGRFDMIAVPYQLMSIQEEQIYQRDLKILGETKPICPHALELLCKWAVMTRLKQANPDHYEENLRPLIARLDPKSKVRIYNNQSPYPTYSRTDAKNLLAAREKIIRESVGSVIYEGRFGASPREIRAILYHSAQSAKYSSLTPMAVFDELRELVKDKSLYEFLQFEPRAGYHDAEGFIREIEDEFAETFETEAIEAMTLVSSDSYEDLLRRYINHVVAEVKREKIYDPRTGTSEAPSEVLMTDIEKICGISSNKKDFREGLLGRLASWKIDRKADLPDVMEVFSDIYDKIKRHYYEERSKYIQTIFKVMLNDKEAQEKNEQVMSKNRQMAETTLNTLTERFGYPREAALDCLRFVLNHNRNR